MRHQAQASRLWVSQYEPLLATDPLMGVNVFTQIRKYQLQRVSTGELTQSSVNTTLQAE